MLASVLLVVPLPSCRPELPSSSRAPPLAARPASPLKSSLYCVGEEKEKEENPREKNHPKKEKNRKNALIRHQTVTPIGLLGKFISKVTVKTKQKSVKKETNNENKLTSKKC